MVFQLVIGLKAAAEPEPDGIDVADDGREPRDRGHRGARAHADRQPDACRPFRHVEHRDEHTRGHARRAHHVCRTEVAAADAA